jgi:hypothetical protein
MEDILTQRFNYASITLYRNYCKLDEKKQNRTTFNDDLDFLDEEDDFFVVKNTSGGFIRNPSIGKIVTIPPKTNNKIRQPHPKIRSEDWSSSCKHNFDNNTNSYLFNDATRL